LCRKFIIAQIVGKVNILGVFFAQGNEIHLKVDEIHLQWMKSLRDEIHFCFAKMGEILKRQGFRGKPAFVFCKMKNMLLGIIRG